MTVSRLIGILVIATGVMALSGCDAIENALAEALSDIAFEGVTDVVMGEDEIKSSTVSVTDSDGSEGVSEEVRERYAPPTDETVIVIEPAFDDPDEAVEALFNASDLALLEGSTPAQNQDSTTFAPSTFSREGFQSGFHSYYHLPNQSADFEFPLESDIVGSWNLDRLVFEGIEPQHALAFIVDVSFSLVIEFFDGTGDVEMIDSASGWPRYDLEAARASSDRRGFETITRGTQRVQIPFVGQCTFTPNRCVLVPNVGPSRTAFTIPVKIYAPEVENLERILRGGQDPNGLMLFVRAWSSPDISHPRFSSRTSFLGLPVRLRSGSSVQFNWFVEDFQYDTSADD